MENQVPTPQLADLSRRQQRRVRGQMAQLEVPAGTVLIREGTPGREFFLLDEGAVDVEIDGRTVTTLGAGDFFGEMALLGGGRRNATVVTSAAASVEVMNRREFATVRDLWPELSEVIDLRAQQRAN